MKERMQMAMMNLGDEIRFVTTVTTTTIGLYAGQSVADAQDAW